MPYRCRPVICMLVIVLLCSMFAHGSLFAKIVDQSMTPRDNSKVNTPIDKKGKTLGTDKKSEKTDINQSEQTDTKTILLDMESIYLSKAQKAVLYNVAFQTLKQAEDLGTILDKSSIPQKSIFKNVISTCQCLDNSHPLCKGANPSQCLSKVAKTTNATYAVYGNLQDMDDLYLLEMKIIDVAKGESIHAVKTTLPITAKSELINQTIAETTCKLTKRFGCGEAPEIVAAPVVAPAVKVPEESDPEVLISDEIDQDIEADMVFEDEIEEPDPVAARKPPVELTNEQVKLYKTTGWVMVGISAASLIGGATCTGLMYKYKSDYDNAKPGEGAFARDAKDKTKMMQWTSIGLYSVAGVTAAVGIPLLVLGYLADDYNQAQESALLLPTVGPNNFGLALSGRF